MKNKEKENKPSFKERVKGFFGRFKGFNTLVMMQLKDRLNVSFKADKKGALIKMALFGLLFGALIAVIVIIFTLLNKLGVLGSTGYVPISMFNLLLYMIIIMNIVSCIVRLTNALFFSEDNQVLLTYPVKPNTIFLSKLVVLYIVELLKSFAIIVPLFIGYGITYNFSFIFYPWLFLCFLILALVPVAIASMVCIPFMYIKMFFKKFQFIQGGFFLAALIAITVLIFYVVNLLPEDLHVATWWATKYFPAIIKFTQNAEKVLAPFVFLSTMILGYKSGGVNNPKFLRFITMRSGLTTLAILGVCAILLVLSYLLAKPLFFSMASKPFEYKKIHISHNFRILRNKNEGLYEQAIVPIYDHELSKYEQQEEVKKLNKFLRKLNREEKLFLRRKVDMKRITHFLRKYSKRKKGEADPFELITIEEFKKRASFGYIIQYRLGIPSLVLVKRFTRAFMECYDPNYLGRKNHKYHPMASTLIKDILLDLRTPGNILNNYLLFIITPLATLVLNSVFAAMNTSASGKLLTIIFNTLIIALILCASNVFMASIYSREGSSSYLLKVSPTNYIKSLSIKLLIRMVIVTSSIIFTIVIYHDKAPANSIDFALFFFAFLFIYLGHLLWSAELDYMNPQDRLYAEVGQQQGNIANPNETLSSVLAFIVPIVFTAVVYFFCNENMVRAFRRIFLVALFFFVARLVLFILKIVGYGTSRNERTAN